MNSKFCSLCGMATSTVKCVRFHWHMLARGAPFWMKCVRVYDSHWVGLLPVNSKRGMQKSVYGRLQIPLLTSWATMLKNKILRQLFSFCNFGKKSKKVYSNVSAGEFFGVEAKTNVHEVIILVLIATFNTLEIKWKCWNQRPSLSYNHLHLA